MSLSGWSKLLTTNNFFERIMPENPGSKTSELIQCRQTFRETALAIKDFTCIFTKVHLKIANSNGSISFINETEGCPPKKRAADSTNAPMATWFCRGLSVPCSSGRKGHGSIQTN